MERKNLFSRFPDALVLLICLIILAAILTYIVPAGEFTRVEDPVTKRMVVEAGTFHTIDPTPVTFGQLFMAVPSGMSGAATIIFFLLLIGGAFGVVTGTGALDALAGKTITKFKGGKSDQLIIAGLILFFGFVSSVVGMYGECLAFIPIIMMLTISLGYDALVGTAIVMCGISAGYGAATLNPFTVQIAQGIAGLPILSGLGFRWVFWIVVMAVLIWYILSYCKKIKADPSKSLVKDIDYSDIKVDESHLVEMTGRHVAVLTVFFGSLLLLIFLMIKLQFTMAQISAYFLLVGIIAGIAYGMHVNDMVSHFMSGAQKMVYASLLVGFASAISIMLNTGKILDTIVHYASLPLQYMPNYLAAGFMVVVQSVINLFIPSGSGQAMVVMPIMAPLSDVLGFSRQIGVLAYQMGDGFANIVVPTLGILMAGIGMGRVPYPTWLKFSFKLFLLLMLVGIIFCILAVLIGLS